MKSEIEKITITNKEDLSYLVDRFCNGPPFAATFEFISDQLWEKFLQAAGLTIDIFNEKHYYFDKENGIHISESEKGYVWISTMGLVSQSRITDNRYINACYCQQIVLLHLLDDAITLANDETSYDIDSYNYSMIEQLTPALFHNTIFYFETLAKAYLSVNDRPVPPTHKLEKLLQLTRDTMFEEHQNNTLFHANTIPLFEEIVHHIASIPKPFKEQYVKYDDNPKDTTLIEFHPERLKNLHDLVTITHDMVTDLYYEQNKSIYFRSNLYQRLLEKHLSDEEKERIEHIYGFLLDKG